MDEIYELDGAALRKHMIEYIRTHFGDLLGPHVELLEQPGGLEELAGLVESGALDKRA